MATIFKPESFVGISDENGSDCISNKIPKKYGRIRKDSHSLLKNTEEHSVLRRTSRKIILRVDKDFLTDSEYSNVIKRKGRGKCILDVYQNNMRISDTNAVIPIKRRPGRPKKYRPEFEITAISGRNHTFYDAGSAKEILAHDLPFNVDHAYFATPAGVNNQSWNKNPENIHCSWQDFNPLGLYQQDGPTSHSASSFVCDGSSSFNQEKRQSLSSTPTVIYFKNEVTRSLPEKKDLNRNVGLYSEALGCPRPHYVPNEYRAANHSTSEAGSREKQIDTLCRQVIVNSFKILNGEAVQNVE